MSVGDVHLTFTMQIPEELLVIQTAASITGDLAAPAVTGSETNGNRSTRRKTPAK